MKTTLKLLALGFTLLNLNSAFAQLKINSTGKVGIGTNSPQYQLHTVGNSFFVGNLTLANWTNATFDWSGACGAPNLYGSSDWYLILGKPTKRIGQIHAYQIRYTEIIKDSDDSLKTEVNSLSNSLSLIKQLNGKSYFLRSSFTDSIPDSVRGDFLRKNMASWLEK